MQNMHKSEPGLVLGGWRPCALKLWSGFWRWSWRLLSSPRHPLGERVLPREVDVVETQLVQLLGVIDRQAFAVEPAVGLQMRGSPWALARITRRPPSRGLLLSAPAALECTNLMYKP